MDDVLAFFSFAGVLCVAATYFLYMRRRDERTKLYPPEPLEITAEATPEGETPKGVRVKWTRRGYEGYALHLFRFEGGVPRSADDIPNDMRALYSGNEKEGSILDRSPKPNEDVFYAAYLEGSRKAVPLFWWYKDYLVVGESVAYTTIAVPVPAHPLDEFETELNEQKRRKNLEKRQQEMEAEKLSEVEHLHAALGEKLQSIAVLGEGLTLFAEEFTRIEANNAYEDDLKERLRIAVTNIQEDWVTTFSKK